MVKRSENGVITNPFFLAPGHTLEEANEPTSTRARTRSRTSPVAPMAAPTRRRPFSSRAELGGIITNRDMKFETDMSQLIDNVMTKDNLVTAPEGTTLDEAREILRRHKIEKLPIVDQEF